MNFQGDLPKNKKNAVFLLHIFGTSNRLFGSQDIFKCISFGKHRILYRHRPTIKTLPPLGKGDEFKDLQIHCWENPLYLD